MNVKRDMVGSLNSIVHTLTANQAAATIARAILDCVGHVRFVSRVSWKGSASRF